ncbi:hypothetical protein IC801_06545 [Geobacillus sp. 44B]|nr:hypothetical protein IC801_06545 [Geobacillus sp. 44B]
MFFLSILFLIVWFYITIKHSEVGFYILVILTLLFQPMLSLNMNGNYVALTDLLWFVYFPIFIYKYRKYCYVIYNNMNIFFILGGLFLFLYIIIPFIGFSFDNNVEISLFQAMSPSIRLIQWVSYGYMSLILAIQGDDKLKIFKKVTIAIGIATLIHSIYSLFEFAAFLGFFDYNSLPHVKFYQDKKSWFYWWRATGLLPNPNTLGVLSVFSACSLFLSWMWKLISSRVFTILFIGSLISLFLTTSRTAILVFFGTVFVMVIIEAIINRNVIKLVYMIVLGLVSIVVLLTLLSSEMTSRLQEIFYLFNGSGEIKNLTGRQEFWIEAFEKLKYDTFFVGTLISPYLYYNEISTDNGYIALLLQFPLLSLIFFAWIFSAFILLIQKCKFRFQQYFSISILVGIFAVTNLTLNLMIESVLLVAYFTLLGSLFGDIKTHSSPYTAKNTKKVYYQIL